MQNSNYLLNNLGIPHYSFITADQIEPAVNQIIAESRIKLNKLEEFMNYNSPTWENFLEPLSQIERECEAVFNPITHLLSVKNSEALRQSYEKVQETIVAFNLEIHQNYQFYLALKKIMSDTSLWGRLNPAKKRVIELRIRNAKLSGLELDKSKKERFNQISTSLTKLTTEFSNNVLDATKIYSLIITNRDDLKGLPDSVIAMASDAYKRCHDSPQNDPTLGPWAITLEAPLYAPFLQYSQIRDLRKALYFAFVTRASNDKFDNTEKIYAILGLRKEQAQLLGFSTYAEYSISQKMAQHVPAVDKLINDLLDKSIVFARQDFTDLNNFARSTGFTEDLNHWDIPYYIEKFRQEKFSFSEEELRAYFPLPRVLDGLFRLINHLFGVTIKISTSCIEKWHADVNYYDVFDTNNNIIAGFFLDLYSRPANKRDGAWADNCVSRGLTGNTLHIPIAQIVCNNTPPVGDTPSLMTFREVTTLFHEFGHALQQMLTTVNEWGVAGFDGIEWDAVELASQFMENWCYHKPTLQSISGHFKTNQSIPDDLYDKICSAKNFRSASDMIRQLHFAAIDIELHHRYDETSGHSIFAINQEIAQKTSILPPLNEDRYLCSFRHIFSGGYAAGYYSYKWAEVLSADSFSAFEEAGLEKPSTMASIGKKFRDTVLATGGARHPSEVFIQFRGRDPKVEPLLRHNGLLT